MNNFHNCVEKEKIKIQIERAEKQKSSLIRNIYSEYELYLNLVRDLLNISVEKGFNELNKQMDEKISTIFNVAFVPAYNPVPLQTNFPPHFQPMMNNGYNCNFPELKST